MATIKTNKTDYAPGETATITADGFTIGSTIELQIQHITDAGADGILGTIDDTLGNNTGGGHEPWYVTDGGTGDLDGVANGSIQTEWYVNPDDSLNETFLATAQQIETGSDGTFGTTDDVSVGEPATMSFTDSGGSYTIKWYAADPAVNKAPFLPTYEKLTPAEYLASHGGVYPTGSATDPLPNAEAYASPPIPSNLDAVTSLTPKDLELGQIVPFFIEITVSGSTAPENGVITVTPEWLAKTTSGGDFGFNPAYGVLAAFVDKGDPQYTDTGALATVTGIHTTTLDVGGNNERIHSDITVSGLTDGDKVIVEVWVVLKNTITSSVTGNVQTSIFGAGTGSGPIVITGGGKNADISTGNQTVPLLQVGDFFSASADLSVIKSDSPDATTNPIDLTATPSVDPTNLKPGDTFTYTILAKNNSTDTVSNGVVVTDTLDSNLTFFSASNSGTWADNGTAADTVTWSLGALSPGQSQLLTVTVQVKNTAPTSSTTQDLLNSVSITSINSDSNLANNTNTEPTNLVSPALTVSISNAIAVNEGNDLIYTVTLSGGTSTSNITIPLTYAGTATPVLDYNGQPATVTILAGESSGTVTVPTLTDSLVEGTETVEVTLGTPSNPVVSVVDPQGTGDILDSNILAITLTGPTSVVEGATTSNYAVNLSGIGLGTGQSVTFTIDTASGTATEGTDFSALLQAGLVVGTGITLNGISTGANGIISVTATNTSGSNLAVGSTLIHFQVATLQDSIVEGPEVFKVNLASSSATVVNAAVTTTITDSIDVAQIAPTGTTAQQYINGTSQDFSDYYASQGGVVQYGVKGDLINNTNPGVFFYYTGLSNTIKGFDGPDTGSAPDLMTVFIDQSDNYFDKGNDFVKAFTATKNDVNLFKVTDLDGNGIDAGDTVTQVQLNNNQIVLGTGVNTGDVTVNFTPDKVGSLYVISVKYDTNAVKGSHVGLNPANWPTVKYTFTTDVGKNGTIEETDSKGITLAPKFGALMLDGEAAQDSHAPVLTDAELQQVVDQAIDFWAQHGADSVDLSLLRETQVKIADLGGTQLGLTDAANVVTIDDDAAGHGWWTGEGEVNLHMVDLLSTVTHEFGHVLGYDHDVMDASLAVGELELPEFNTQIELVGVQAHQVVDFV
ncbi:MAG: Calx-beta domain-containing protein [Methylococcales bacterium]|nr:Calx-beta domain-containing protein [Methylococcales bacterium]MDP3009347.1 Calx-beta domain-containing protein [Methylococcales bacterium]